MSEKNTNLSEEEMEKRAMENAFKDYYNKNKAPITTNEDSEQEVKSQLPPKMNFETPEKFESRITQETDPDLIVGYEMVDLPSKGYFYEDGLSKVKVEYLTSKDEDILSTPSLIADGTVLDVILKRKIKTPNVDIKKLLTGDKNALILFLRASAYGHEYDVSVTDPRTGNSFKETVDLTKLGYKEPEMPDENGQFTVELPKRKKIVKFRLLTSGEEEVIEKRAETTKELYNREYSEYSSFRLKASIVSIDGKTDRSYIDKFVDAMPIMDTVHLRKKIREASPDIDMSHEFQARDGYKFKATLTVGVDFFFPNL